MPLERPGRNWEFNIKVDVTEIRRQDVNWFKWLLQARCLKCGPFVAESHVRFRA